LSEFKQAVYCQWPYQMSVQCLGAKGKAAKKDFKNCIVDCKFFSLHMYVIIILSMLSVSVPPSCQHRITQSVYITTIPYFYQILKNG